MKLYTIQHPSVGVAAFDTKEAAERCMERLKKMPGAETKTGALIVNKLTDHDWVHCLLVLGSPILLSLPPEEKFSYQFCNPKLIISSGNGISVCVAGPAEQADRVHEVYREVMHDPALCSQDYKEWSL